MHGAYMQYSSLDGCQPSAALYKPLRCRGDVAPGSTDQDQSSPSGSLHTAGQQQHQHHCREANAQAPSGLSNHPLGHQQPQLGLDADSSDGKPSIQEDPIQQQGMGVSGIDVQGSRQQTVPSCDLGLATAAAAAEDSAATPSLFPSVKQKQPDHMQTRASFGVPASGHQLSSLGFSLGQGPLSTTDGANNAQGGQAVHAASQVQPLPLTIPDSDGSPGSAAGQGQVMQYAAGTQLLAMKEPTWHTWPSNRPMRAPTVATKHLMVR